MKIKFLLLFSVLLTILGGCSFLKNTQSQVQDQMQNATKKVADTASSPFSSIKDALSKSLSLVCTFTDDQGRKTESSVKNGAVRVNMMAVKPEDSTSMIMKDKKIYFWNEVKKEGMMMEVPEVSITPLPTVTGITKPTTKTNQAVNGQEVLAMLEKFKDSCKPGVVDDALFMPPADVKFTDLSKMMPPTLPSGTGVPGMSQEQIQQMMKQYAPN